MFEGEQLCLFLLLPRFLTPELTDLTSDFLLEKGIRLLMMDFDNTIVPYTTDVPTERMRSWLEEMNASPVKIAIVSNSKNDRLIRFCETYHLDYIMRAHKPRPRGLQQCMARFGSARSSLPCGRSDFYGYTGRKPGGVTPFW